MTVARYTHFITHLHEKRPSVSPREQRNQSVHGGLLFINTIDLMVVIVKHKSAWAK